MNQKHYIGNRVTSMELYDEIGPVTGVALIVDDENEIFAGNESGYVLEMECPYATSAMANSILAKAKGRTYKGYSAENAPLGIGAELGDGVTVGRVYSMLAYQKLTFGPGHLSAIAAPGEKEVDHEYPYQSPLKREVRRNKAQAYSRISKTAEAIRNEVFGEDGYTGTSLAVQLGEIAGKVKGKINGTDAEALIKAALEKIELSISNDEGTTSFILSGDGTELTSEKFDLHVKAVNIHGKLTAEQIETDKLKVAAANITGKLTIGGGVLPDDLATTGDIPDVSDFLISSDLGKTGTVAIYGGLIDADSIYADSFHMGGALTVYKTQYGSTIGGYLGYDSGFYGRAAGIGIRSENEYSQIVCTDLAARMSYSDDDQHITQVVCGQDLALSSVGSIQFSIGGNVSNVVAGLDEFSFYPAASLTLGTSFFEWSDVFAAGTSMSDLLRRVEDLEAKQGE